MSNERIISTKSESDSDMARGQAVRRIWAGETLKFVYHQWSDRAPVDRIMREANAIGQQELPLWGMGLTSVWKPQ